MNKETLNKLKELAQAATPGPWRLHHQPGEKYTPTLTDAGHYDEDYFAVAAGIDGDGETVVICDNGQYYSVKVREYDCRFIAAANPVAVLELIALADLGLQAEEGRPEPESEENHQKRMAILTAERDRLIAAERTTSPVSQMTEKPDTSQEWAKLDGATAFHLIERHANDWAETGRMMESWLMARMASAASKAYAVPVACIDALAQEYLSALDDEREIECFLTELRLVESDILAFVELIREHAAAPHAQDNEGEKA